MLRSPPEAEQPTDDSGHRSDSVSERDLAQSRMRPNGAHGTRRPRLSCRRDEPIARQNVICRLGRGYRDATSVR